MQNISAPFLGSLYEYASYQGIKEDELRLLLNDPKLDVCSPDNFVDSDEYIKTLEELVKRSNLDYFGLRFGSYLNLKSLGMIYQISLQAASMSQCIYLLNEYLKNTFPIIELNTIEKEDSFEIKITSTLEDKDLERHLLDAVISFMYRETCQMTTSEFLPTIHTPHNYPAEVEKSLSAKVESGQVYSLRFHQATEKMPLNKRRFKKIEALLPQFLSMLNKKIEGYGRFAYQIRNLILNLCRPEIPNFEMVAEQLPYSHRTIQRKLTKEGVSFRQISNEIKRELSDFLQKGSQFKTQDIAYILGYSEPSAYLHAVKKWRVA